MKTLSAILIGGLMACFAIGLTTAQGQQYSLADLGIVKDMDYAVPAAINNMGYVAGSAYAENASSCAFHYDYVNKFMEDAGGLNSRGFAINSMNTVAGDNFPVLPMEPRSHAATFFNGLVTDLGVLPGYGYSRANGINAKGQVVGFSSVARDSAESRAFLWTKQGGMSDIGTLGGAFAQANAINDTGFITGWSQTMAMVPTTHAFLYCQQCAGLVGMRDLGVLGGYSSYGTAINKANHVVGYSTLAANDQRVHAFFYDGYRMVDMGSLGAGGARWGSDISVALALNNSEQVVGYSYLPVVGQMPIQQVAFLWKYASPTSTGNTSVSEKMLNLNKLVVNLGSYLLTSATGINDNGQIVASALDLQSGSVHAVLLTPIPPTLVK